MNADKRPGMRKRWHIPKATTEALACAAFVTWAFGWLPVFIIWNALGAGCDSMGCGMNSNHLAPGSGLFLWLWLGIPIGTGILLGIGFFVGRLWENRPRRVWEPVDDIRTHYGDER